MTVIDRSKLNPAPAFSLFGNYDGTVILGLFDLTLCLPDERFTPLLPNGRGGAEFARVFPLLSFWTNKKVKSVSANFRLKRPDKTMMHGMADDGRISSALYTDVNNGVRIALQDADIGLKEFLNNLGVGVVGSVVSGLLTLVFPGAPLAAIGIGAGGVISDIDAFKEAVMNALSAPSPRWNSIFAHYDLPDKPRTEVVVDPKLARRKDTANRLAKSSYDDEYSPTWTVKVSRQGVFDNIHIAPTMNYKGKKAYMAPICHHDCLHIHWRWGEEFPDRHTKGWDANGPYRVAGAPHVPVNQKVTITADGSKFVYEAKANYAATSSNTNSEQWQIFMHHGISYLTGLTVYGELVFLIELQSGDGEFPPSFEGFYYHNRMLEVDYFDSSKRPDIPRLNESLFSYLEEM
ncbi:MAG: hypothetical protein AAFY41_13045 [Bacteroidota bacterium]